MTRFNRTAGVYGSLFPAKSAQLDFLEAALPQGKRVPARWLDIACGPGQQVAGLTDRGLEAWGLDLASEMIKQAKANRPDLTDRFYIGDMRRTRQEISRHMPGPAGVVYCIGNSLALQSRKRDIERAIAGFHGLLAPGGAVVIQVVNFDRVLAGDLDFLPRIEKKLPGGDPCVLERSYALSHHKGCVWFKTKWTSKGTSRTGRNLIRALRRKDLEGILKAKGFDRLTFKGDYQGRRWGPKAGATIVRARRR